MTEKRFELKVNQHNQCDIVDWVESKEKNAICIYNDLGDYYFSSAKALCELLNELNDEVVKGDLFKLTVTMAIQHRINWLKKQIWDNTDRIDELQSLKKELKL